MQARRHDDTTTTHASLAAARGARVRETVSTQVGPAGLIRSGDRVLVAVSGGADSMALLSILHGLTQEYDFDVSAAHFDHRLRPDGEGERSAAAALAGRLGVSFYAGRADLVGRPRHGRPTGEAHARSMRYTFLDRAAREAGATAIATGHTRDDQAETILMRWSRGAGIRGLAGIPARRGRIVRPLLAIGRADTRRWCRDHSIDFVDDPTNLDRRYERNRVRLDVLPSFPGSVEPLARLGRDAEALLTAIRPGTDDVAARALRRENSNRWSLSLAPLEALNSASKYVLFGDIATRTLGIECEWSRIHFEGLDRLSNSGARTGARLSLPGADVRREHDAMVFVTPGHDKGHRSGPDNPTSLPVPGSARCLGYRFRAEILESHNPVAPIRTAGRAAPPSEGKSTAVFALDALDLPLSVRSVRPGDRVRPFGMAGSKKLSDVFIDSKVPVRRRCVPVVAAAKTLLWIPGVVRSHDAPVHVGCGPVVRIVAHRE